MTTPVLHPAQKSQLRKSLTPPPPVIARGVAAAPKPFAETEARWLPVKSKRMTVAEAGMLAAALGF